MHEPEVRGGQPHNDVLARQPDTTELPVAGAVAPVAYMVDIHSIPDLPALFLSPPSRFESESPVGFRTLDNTPVPGLDEG